MSISISSNHAVTDSACIIPITKSTVIRIWFVPEDFANVAQLEERLLAMQKVRRFDPGYSLKKFMLWTKTLRKDF